MTRCVCGKVKVVPSFHGLSLICVRNITHAVTFTASRGDLRIQHFPHCPWHKGLLVSTDESSFSTAEDYIKQLHPRGTVWFHTLSVKYLSTSFTNKRSWTILCKQEPWDCQVWFGFVWLGFCVFPLSGIIWPRSVTPGRLPWDASQKCCR